MLLCSSCYSTNISNSVAWVQHKMVSIHAIVATFCTIYNAISKLSHIDTYKFIK